MHAMPRGGEAKGTGNPTLKGTTGGELRAANAGRRGSNVGRTGGEMRTHR
jgi:hypothetical protein